jgi:ABC-type uncharacterized transport system auxiliary subunit
VRLAALLLGLAMLSACLGRVPPTTYYRLAAPALRPQEPYPYRVAVMRFRAAPPYQQSDLLYRPSAFEVASYGSSRWEATPAEMLTERFYEALRGSHLFREVTLRGLSGGADLLLQGRVTRFEEVDSPQGAFAELAVEVELTCLRGARTVWQGELSARTPMAERTPDELARAMSESLAAAVGDLLARLGPALRELGEEGCGERK